MRLRKVILNSIPKKAVVQKFNEGDMTHPVETVVYGMHPCQALVFYFMQFILKDFAYEKYPRYIEGTTKSAKVKDVFYYDSIEGIIIRASPYTGGEKWRFHKYKKVKVPDRKKRLVLRKADKDEVTNRICSGNGREHGTGCENISNCTSKTGQGKKVRRQVLTRVVGATPGEDACKSVESGERKVEVAVECPIRKVQRREVRLK